MIEEHRDEIIALGEETYKTPELGSKGFRTGKLIKETFCRFGLEPKTGVSCTGRRISSGPKGDRSRATVMGKLDCIMYDSHPDAARDGTIHVCGHNIQLANMYEVAIGILASGVMEHLGGAADPITIPAGECVGYECRNRLVSQETIHYLGGKQELMCRGGLDDTGMVLQCHMMGMEPGKCCTPDTKGNGFISKTMHFPGKAAHAGSALEREINALNMTELAIGNIHTLRETSRDEDEVRVSIVTKEDGGLVNVAPEHVTMEIMVCAFTVGAMEDASRKINRSIKAAAMTLEGKVEIHDYIGYLPLNTDRQITQLCRDSMVAYEYAGEDAFVEDWETAGSTGLEDISQIMPYIYIWAGGVRGGLHTENYRMDNLYTAYIVPAKVMALIVTDLLWDEGAKGKEIIRDFQPTLTKEEYLSLLEDHQVVDLYNASDL